MLRDSRKVRGYLHPGDMDAQDGLALSLPQLAEGTIGPRFNWSPSKEPRLTNQTDSRGVDARFKQLRAGVCRGTTSSWNETAMNRAMT
jgi:hypothetical protein